MHLLLLLAACGSDPILLEGDPIGSCTYTSPFSGEPECMEFYSTDPAEAEEICSGYAADFLADVPCVADEILGTCTYSSDGVTAKTTVMGDDSSKCGSQRFGCETFARGIWTPAANCDGTDEIVVLEDPFPLPERICVQPLEGEPAGQSEGGEVCTWRAIGGCTEEGRNFIDYSTCDAVLTQRPYYPSAPADDFRTPDDDPRLADATWLGELGWVTDQVNACGCVCCHSDALAPQGPGNWYVEAEGVWTDTMWPSGLAIAAGWIDSSLLGAYPASENNGFDRSRSGLPSTDPDRMIAFFEGELTRRGYSREDFADFTPIPEPFYRQALFEPEACENGEGVAADGTVTWSGGGARYLYVLEADAENPGAPPNLDKPAGTLWKLDVAPTSGALLPGIAYGSTPEGATQAVPGSGAPPALVDGQTYYLYAQADLLIPITRCLFTYRE